MSAPVAERDPVEIAEDFLRATEEMLEAARKMNAPRMMELSSDRADLMFELRLALEESRIDDPAPITAVLAQVRELEHRLTHVAQLVLGTLERVLPTGPARTYGPTGKF